MSVQLDIFHARESDPETSKAAARAVNIKKSCDAVLAALWRRRTDFQTFTDGDLAALMHDERSIVARRRGDLVELYGFAEPCLRDGEQETRPGRRGRFEAVWLLTPEGWARAEQANAEEGRVSW